MISKGKEILESHGLNPTFFMAPGHTFDENTLKALSTSGIKHITDGYSLQPYEREGLREFLAEHKDICAGFDKLTDEIKPVAYNKNVRNQERRYIRKKSIKRKLLSKRFIGDERWQSYLQKSYSSNRYLKTIKRILYLPTLFINAVRMIAFLLIFLFLLRSVSYVMRTNGESKDRFAGFYAEKKDSIDILMFGSSTVGTSFSAPYMWGRYGFTSYPLSTNSLRPKAIPYLIEEGLKYQSPKLLVIEMRTFIADDAMMASDEGHIRETVDNMRYSLNRIRAINALTEEFDDKLPFYLDIIKYHPNWGMLLEPDEWKKFNYTDYNELKGFSVLAHTEGYRDETPNVYTENRVPIPESQEQVLRELLKYLKEKKIETLFVVSPRAKEDNYEEMMNYAGDIIREAGYDFVDMNYMYDQMEFDYRHDFDDGAHTNIWGAVKCSDALGEYIKDHYSITSDHDEKVTEQWDRAYNSFIELYDSTVEQEK